MTVVRAVPTSLVSGIGKVILILSDHCSAVLQSYKMRKVAIVRGHSQPVLNLYLMEAIDPVEFNTKRWLRKGYLKASATLLSSRRHRVAWAAA